MYTLVRTKDGELLAFGSNVSGQLGLGKDTAEKLVPCAIALGWAGCPEKAS